MGELMQIIPRRQGTKFCQLDTKSSNFVELVGGDVVVLFAPLLWRCAYETNRRWALLVSLLNR